MSIIRSASNKRKKVKRYRVQLRVNGKMKQAWFMSREAAKTWQRKMQEERENVQRGIALPFVPTSFEDYAGKWLCERMLKTPPASFCQENQKLKIILEFIDKEYMHTLTKGAWEKILDRIQADRELSESTYNRYRSLVHKIYEDAMRDDKPAVLTNPITLIRTRTEPKSEMNIFESTKSLDRYLEAAWDISPSFWIAAMFLGNLGCRVGEALAIRWSDIDQGKNQIYIGRTRSSGEKKIVNRVKSKNPTYQPINPTLKQALKLYRRYDQVGKKEDLLCRWIEPPKRDFNKMWKRDLGLKHSWFRKQHHKLCEKLGLPMIRVHDLRHTFATHYLNAGGSVYHLQGLLNHSDIKITQRYKHFIEAEQQKASRVFSAGAVMPKLKLIASEGILKATERVKKGKAERSA